MSGGGSIGPSKEQQLATWYALNSLNKIDTSAVDNANANMASQAELMSQNLSNRPDYVYSVDGSDEARQRAEQAYYNNMVNNLQPQFDQQRSDLETRLANQGLSVGSEAYQRAMNDLTTQQNNAYTNAANQAVLSGQNAFSQSLADAIKAGNFTNTSRQMPVSEIITLLSNSPSGYDIAMDKYGIMNNYANAVQQSQQQSSNWGNALNGALNGALAFAQPSSQQSSGANDAINGALSGAAAGSAFGPWGAAAGGLAGGLSGYLS